MQGLTLHAVPGIPLIERGDDIAATIFSAIEKSDLSVKPGDIFVIAQKIISKSEGRLVELATVEASPEAIRLAAECDKDPRVVELILRESKRIVRKRVGVIIAEHRLGIILANAGIDRSNIDRPDETALLLPKNPDRSARQIRQELERAFGFSIGVVITDSIGRPWRLGTTGVAIGTAGVPALLDLRGRPDIFGRKLEVSEIATADSVAAAAGLLLGEGAERTPVVLVHGLAAGDSDQKATDVLRPADEDMFRD